MMIEGRGIAAPAPDLVRLASSDVALLRQVADERDRRRGYSRRADRWGLGYVPHATMCGLLGEHALCVYLNRRGRFGLSVDTEWREFGDAGKDVIAHGYAMQVKTKVTGRHNLIRRVDSSRRIRGLECDAFVFGKIQDANTVGLLGWISADAARRVGKHIKSTRDTHWNLLVPGEHLEPMCRLVDVIQTRRVT